MQKLDSKLVCEFLERWPSLEELQKVSSAELKKFFRHRRGRHGELTEWRMQGIGQATPAIRDRAVIEAKQTVVQVIAQLIRTLLEVIATLDRKIAEAAEAHPDYFIFESLPGAGAALAAALAGRSGFATRSVWECDRGTEIQRNRSGHGAQRQEIGRAHV